MKAIVKMFHGCICNLCRDALEEDNDLQTVLKKAFLDADKALHRHLCHFNNGETHRARTQLKEMHTSCEKSKVFKPCSPAADSFLTAGTTATVALLRDGVELVVGSAGDSRAMLCRQGQSTKLSTDHTPDRKDERRR